MTINVTLNNVADLTQTTTAQTTINNNSSTITTGFLSAYNTTGDQLLGTMDANSNQIINLPAPSSGSSPVRLQDINNGVPVIITGYPLTTINDTNVTLTPTGSSSTALVNAAGITASWAGTLSVARGGTSVSTVPSLQTLIGQTFVSYTITGVNFNSTNTDYAFTITLPTGFSNYVIQYIRISNASASLSTSTFGVFTGSGGSGTQIVATGTVCTITSASANTVNNTQNCGIINVGATQSINYGTLYFRVQTPQGSPATATVRMAVLPVS